jgi:allantoin racemase
MKIKVIIPNSGMDRVTLNSRETMLSHALSQNTQISVDCIEYGPDSIESNSDEVLAGIPLVKQCIQAEQEGFDAVVVYCFSDLAIDAVRENVSIPVVGPGEVAIAAAGMISNRFTVITTTDENISRTERRLMKNKIAGEKMTSVRALNIPVVELREDPDATKRYLEKVCGEAAKEERIDTVILGCLGLAQYGDFIKEKFGVQVIDPAFIAVAYAEMCARLRLVHSRKAYSRYEKGTKNGL